MPKKFIRRFLPEPQAVKNNKILRVFGSVLHEPNLWHLNRRSAAGGFCIGLFFAFWPVPFQMWLSAGVAIPFRANLPLSVATVWVTNPFTIPPIFYAAYKIGSTVLGTKPKHFEFQFSWQWVVESISTIGPAFLVGCAICSIIASAVGYFTLNWIWRFQVKKAWERRRLARAKAKVQAQ
ncbi:DUF2062 domain-containing protein [Alteromonas naphthalenivorans]|uniref:Flagellar biosynthesis protein FlhF n=1 Tax=Alteromonas naphthalenivorans TaxID=715451 RepID=F5Z7H9_ALTNA|nr:DUF2062 domain-containing protein [Alteromonas naphthalenivorans]AEF03022.1 flagellar biosynthesis protein FlhF [Alteromonas naphthalenivorans]